MTSSTPVYKSILHACASMYRTGGIQAFFHGIVPSQVKIVPAAAIMFTVSERLKRLFHS